MFVYNNKLFIKRIYIICILIYIPFITWATWQNGDILIWNRDTLSILTNPLEKRSDIEDIRKSLLQQSFALSTACWNGYIAQWKIENNKLYLINIFNCDLSAKADLKKLLTQDCKKDRVWADWFTDTIIIPKGRMLFSLNLGYAYFYEKELHLFLKAGKIIGQKEYDNTKTHLSVFGYTNTTDSLSKYMYAYLNWGKIPHIQGTEKVYVSTQTGCNRHPQKVELLRASKNIQLNNEVLRVFHSLPDWDVLYAKGKCYHFTYTVCIVFSEEIRKKYNKDSPGS